ncbi:MAG: PhnD/SsuA/transferrin family substrate-binding protein [Nibricoccus sp.]
MTARSQAKLATLRLFAARAILLSVMFLSASSPSLAEKASERIKMGFTRSMFVDLNEADTRAAVKSYALLLASNANLSISEEPGVYDSPQTVAEAFSGGTADIVSLTTAEYLSLPAGSTYPRMIVAAMGGSQTEQYVLVVRQDSPWRTIADLRGKRLFIYASLRGLLSNLWLDVLLASNGLEQAPDFFGSVVSTTKPSRTVLPVFFQQADACIVTLTGLKVMTELNPQLHKDLRVIATSPEIIPAVTCFRAGMPPSLFEQTIKAAVNAQDTTSGQQILMIFQCDKISEITEEHIASVRELLETQRRLRSPAAAHIQTTAEQNHLSYPKS